MDDNQSLKLDRRSFLKASLFGAGTLLTGAAAEDAFARSKGKPDFKFLVVSDTHVGATGDARRFRQALPLIRRERADFVLHTGDVVNNSVGNIKQLQTAKTMMKSLPKPLYVVPGNHDISWSNEQELNASWTDAFGPTEIEFTHKDWNFVGFNSMALTVRCKDRTQEHRILNWMEQNAARWAKKRTVFFYHIPNFKLPVNWSWMPGWSKTAAPRWAKLMQTIKPVAGIAGHWHVGVSLATKNLPLLVAPAISGRFRMQTGYLRCTVKGDQLLAERVMIETRNKRSLPALVNLFLLPRGHLPRGGRRTS